MNTATCRRSAAKAANQGRFLLAATYYNIAIKNYPGPDTSLGKADIKNLMESRDSCLSMLKEDINND